MRQPASLRRRATLTLLLLPSLVTAAPLSCTDNLSHETIYTTPPGIPYDILCYVDHPGNDLASHSGLATFEECIDLCDATRGCVDVSWFAPDGTCWMKRSVGEPVENGGIWTARSRVERGDKDVTCVDGLSNGTRYEAVGGGVFEVLCGIDYAGGDLGGSVEESFAGCVSSMFSRILVSPLDC